MLGAQWLSAVVRWEQLSYNRKVGGSIPALPTVHAVIVSMGKTLNSESVGTKWLPRLHLQYVIVEWMNNGALKSAI